MSSFWIHYTENDTFIFFIYFRSFWGSQFYREQTSWWNTIDDWWFEFNLIKPQQIIQSDLIIIPHWDDVPSAGRHVEETWQMTTTKFEKCERNVQLVFSVRSTSGNRLIQATEVEGNDLSSVLLETPSKRESNLGYFLLKLTDCQL